MLFFAIYKKKKKITDPTYYFGDGPSTSQNGGILLGCANSSSDSMDIINGLHSQTVLSTHEIRSPLAATRANSLASAASPTGSACTKPSSSETSASVISTSGPEPMFLV